MTADPPHDPARQGRSHRESRPRRSRRDDRDHRADRDERDDRGDRPERSPRALELEPRVVSAEGIRSSQVDQDALRVISRLTRNGFEAYMVGGCVRDLLLGRKPKDFDLATAAHPRQVKRLFRNGRIIGRRFKLVHVIYGNKVIETATFRREPDRRAADGGDEDLLILEDNDFGSAAEDALRRDFTINALFHDPIEGRILDYVGGLEDLDDRTLRTIGDPAVRFAEDPVRILRAIKFATRLAFRIDEPTWIAMCEAADDLSRAAAPRVLEEILRLMRSGTALGAFRMMRKCGALRVLLPQIDEFLSLGEQDPALRERSEGFWRLLEALDNDVHAGFEPSTALSLAVLFLRVVEFEYDPESRTLPGDSHGVLDVADEVMDPLVRPARVSRRAVGRSIRIIANQARFTQSSSKSFRPLLFMHQDDFEESLQLFRLHSAAWGQGWDLYEAWVARYEEAKQVDPEQLAAMRKKRRGRRRGRRKPKKSGGN